MMQYTIFITTFFSIFLTVTTSGVTATTGIQRHRRSTVWTAKNGLGGRGPLDSLENALGGSASSDALLDVDVGLDIGTGSGSEPWVKRNCALFGVYADDGDKTHNSEGVLQEPRELNKAAGTPLKFFGMYAHIQGDEYVKGDPMTYFNGSEFIPWIERMKGTGASAILTLMPVRGWGGLQYHDNAQAVQTVKVLKKFIDANIDVYLRFGHEMQWYFYPGSDDAQDGRPYYLGGAANFTEGWEVMTKTIRATLPQVKMFWSPMIELSESTGYARYWPGKEYVDVVGIDYYPTSDFDDLAKYAQDFHDKYALAYDLPFHMGETGYKYENQTLKEQWLRTVTSNETCTKLPKLEAVHWFNFLKEGMQRGSSLSGDFRVIQPDGKGFTATFRKIMRCGWC